MTASGEAPIQNTAPAPAIRVLHLAQSDGGGGANKAAFRLHRSLRDLGVASTFHPGRKIGEDPEVVPAWPPIGGDFISTLAAWLDSHSLDFYPDRRGDVFSPIRFCYGRPRRRLVAAADVVCLHWIAGSFLHPRHLARLDKPLVWRLSDLWPFTGGCHFPGACRKFEDRCGNCPSLGSAAADDLAARGFAARERYYEALDLTVAAPSRWIAEEAKRSKLFGHRRIVHIPTGIDTSTFQPIPRIEARRLLDLPLDAPMLLFGAMDSTTNSRKGFAPLRRALGRFAANTVGARRGRGRVRRRDRCSKGRRGSAAHSRRQDCRRGAPRTALRRSRRAGGAVHRGQSAQCRPRGAVLWHPGGGVRRRRHSRRGRASTQRRPGSGRRCGRAGRRHRLGPRSRRASPRSTPPPAPPHRAGSTSRDAHAPTRDLFADIIAARTAERRGVTPKPQRAAIG